MQNIYYITAEQAAKFQQISDILAANNMNDLSDQCRVFAVAGLQYNLEKKAELSQFAFNLTNIATATSNLLEGDMWIIAEDLRYAFNLTHGEMVRLEALRAEAAQVSYQAAPAA